MAYIYGENVTDKLNYIQTEKEIELFILQYHRTVEFYACRNSRQLYNLFIEIVEANVNIE